MNARATKSLAANGLSFARAMIAAGDTNSRPGRAPANDELPSDGEILARLLSSAALVDACKVVQANTCDDQIDRIMYRSGESVTLQAIEWFVDQQFVNEEGNRLPDHPAIAVKFCGHRPVFASRSICDKF